MAFMDSGDLDALRRRVAEAKASGIEAEAARRPKPGAGTRRAMEDMEIHEQCLLDKGRVLLSGDEFAEMHRKLADAIGRFLDSRGAPARVKTDISVTDEFCVAAVSVLSAGGMDAATDDDMRLLVACLTGEVTESPPGRRVEWRFEYWCDERHLKLSRLAGAESLLFGMPKEWTGRWDSILRGFGVDGEEEAEASAAPPDGRRGVRLPGWLSGIIGRRRQ